MHKVHFQLQFHCTSLQVLYSVDYSKPKLQAIKTCPGKPEERKELLPGPKGMAICTWEDGHTYESDIANLLLASRANVKGLPKKVKAKAKGKSKAKAKAKGKAKAKAIAAGSEEGSKESEEDEEEEEEEEEEKGTEAMEAGAADEPTDEDAKTHNF